MTEKRGTGIDYGQDKLKDRSESLGSEVTTNGKKPKSKVKLLAIVIIAVIGAGSLYPVLFNGKKLPTEKAGEVVVVTPDGTPAQTLTDDLPDADKPVAKKSDANIAAADKATLDKAADEHAVPPPLVQPTEKPADTTDSSSVTGEATEVAAPEKPSVDVPKASEVVRPQISVQVAASPGSDKTSADNVRADKTTLSSQDSSALIHAAEHPVITGNGSSVPTEDPAMKLIDVAAPVDPSEVNSKPADTASPQVSVQPVPSVAQAHAPVIVPVPVSETTVVASHENITAAQPASKPAFSSFDASKFGMERVAQTAPTQNQPNTVQSPDNQVIQVNDNPAALNEPGIIKNYKGQASVVPYELQSQNTVYVYGNFSAKVYLLPIAKNEKIRSYLADSKGWEVTLLPDNIIRINRSPNKAAWTDATDLFLISGKRTYTIILQAVGEPQQRTDTLRYFEQKASDKSSRK